MEFVQKKKTFRVSEVERELGLPRAALSRQVNKGLLEKFGYGHRALADGDFNEVQI